MIKTPIIAIMKPSIFKPAVASFWSPNPNTFFDISLASYTNITPINDNIRPRLKNIVSFIFTLHPLL